MRIYIVLLIMFLSGCTTSLSKQVVTVTNQYDAIIFDDGISLEEAKVIAQRTLIKQNLVKIYDMENPKHFKNVSELPDHEKYWFISFQENKIINIEFVFMAIIDKKSGKVIFANDYSEGKDWILEAALRGV